MPTPSKGESQQAFMHRCVPYVIKEGKKQDQAVAECLNIFKKREAEDMNIRLDYDEKRRRAILLFPDGKELALANVTQVQAQAFLEQHAVEFGKRGLCLTTPTLDVVRAYD